MMSFRTRQTRSKEMTVMDKERMKWMIGLFFLYFGGGAMFCLEFFNSGRY